MSWLLSFVPFWAWGLVGLALAGAAWSYLGARAGLAVLFGIGLWASYLAGVAQERERGEAARLAAELAIARDDIAKAKRAETDAAVRAANLDAASRSNQDIIDDLAARLAAQQAEQLPVEPVPPAEPGARDPAPRTAPARPCRCVLTDADERFLQQIR